VRTAILTSLVLSCAGLLLTRFVPGPLPFALMAPFFTAVAIVVVGAVYETLAVPSSTRGEP
jgi:hypothetical protein